MKTSELIDEILSAAKEERDRIVAEVMLSHTEEVDGFSYRWFAGRIADEVAAIASVKGEQ